MFKVHPSAQCFRVLDKKTTIIDLEIRKGKEFIFVVCLGKS